MIRRFSAFLLFICCFSLPVMGQELYRIRVENKVSGRIMVSTNEGVTWQLEGRVIRPTLKVNKRGYTASRWVNSSEVAASAVNAIHITLEHNFVSEEGETYGVIFSLIPKEFLTPPGKNYHSYLSHNSSIQTNIKAGTSIFGGDFAPLVGNKVRLLNQKRLTNLSLTTTFEIVVDLPDDYPVEIEFENRFGGRVTLKNRNGSQELIGQVLQPVVGIGRVLGTPYTDSGRLRANHAGVICISTSNRGDLAGFQIVPSHHAMKDEMINARLITQWMVVGPLSPLGASLEGVSPLFRGYLNPRYSRSDWQKSDWYERILKRFLVQFKYQGSDEWQSVPAYSLKFGRPLPSWAFKILRRVTHIRILFPIFD